ncbi:MAG: MerR family transcriptional regulator [Ramlibacter sp.]
MESKGLRIGELASLLGTTTKTLRFYEQIGLLAPPRRSESAYRLYDGEAAQTARLVVELRRLDLTLPELQELLANGHEATRRSRLQALMDEKLRAIYLQLSVLQGRCDDLEARHAALLATPRGRPPQCICEALLRPCTCDAAARSRADTNGA